MINLGTFKTVFTGVRPPPTPPLTPPPAVTPKFKRDDRCIVMGIDFWVIWVADFNHVVKFLRPPAKGHPPPTVMPRFKLNNRYIVMDVDFGVI